MRIEPTDAGNVKIFTTTRAGAVVFTIGAETDEFIRVTPEDAFTYRGRRYTGVVMLTRGDVTPKNGYSFMVKKEDGGDVKWPVWHNIATAVGDDIRTLLEASPDITAAATRAGLADKLARATAAADKLAGDLADARNHEDALRAQLAELDKP